jgi:hypothetical protein
MQKEVKKSTHRTNLDLFIFELLKKGLNPAKISKQFNLSKQKIDYHLSSLKRNGCIKKIGYGTYEILKDFDKNKSKKITHIGLDNPHTNLDLFKADTVRGHAFQFTLSINPNLRNWNKREEIMKKMGIEFKTLNIFGGGQRLTFKGRKIWLTDRSIIIFEKASYMADNSTEARKYAVYDFFSLVEALERHLKADFGATRQDRLKFKVSRQHYALIKNALAKQYDKEGKKLEISNEKGQWFIIDNSFNLHEAETVHPETADNDNLKVQNFFNGLKKFENFTPEFVVSSIGKVTENQMVFAENMKSHIKAVQDLGNGVQDWKEGTNKLIDQVSELTKIVKDIKKKDL